MITHIGVAVQALLLYNTRMKMCFSGNFVRESFRIYNMLYVEDQQKGHM